MGKLSPKESVDGADTVQRGSLRVPDGFSKGKAKSAKLRGRSPRGFAGTLLKGQLFHSAPRIFNSYFLHCAKGRSPEGQCEHSRDLLSGQFFQTAMRICHSSSFYQSNEA